jgi:prephenate dehydrogenase
VRTIANDLNPEAGLKSPFTPKVLIIGGVGRMGRWISTFLASKGYEVDIYDTSPAAPHLFEDMKRLVKRRGLEYKGQLFKDPKDLDIPSFDVVFLAVPMDSIKDVTEMVAPSMKEGSLICDLSSRKRGPMKAIAGIAPKWVDVLGIHPLFGPGVESTRGHVVAIVPMKGRCSEEWIRWMKGLLESEGAMVVETTPGEHDQIMAFVQVLPHLSLIAMAETMRECGIDVESAFKMRTPIYELFFLLMGRILSQNPELYASIQVNPDADEAREVFIKACQRIASLAESENEAGIAFMIERIASYFGNENASYALSLSNSMINWLIRERTRWMDSVGKIVGVRNIEKGTVHIGVLEGVDLSRGMITIREGKRRTVISIKRAKLLDDEELFEWRVRRFGTRRRDISVLLPEEVDEELILDILSRIGGVCRVEILDVYRGPQIGEGMKGVTFGIHIFGDMDPSAVWGEAERMVRRLGYRVRGG